MPQSVPTLKSSHPMLAVADVEVATEYYRDILGFQIDHLWGDPIFYGLVSRGDVGIDLIHSHSIQGEPGDKGGAYIIVDDVDALHTELEGKGAGLWGPARGQGLWNEGFCGRRPERVPALLRPERGLSVRLT